jgi:hypothetical protein
LPGYCGSRPPAGVGVTVVNVVQGHHRDQGIVPLHLLDRHGDRAVRVERGVQAQGKAMDPAVAQVDRRGHLQAVYQHPLLPAQAVAFEEGQVQVIEVAGLEVIEAVLEAAAGRAARRLLGSGPQYAMTELAAVR